MRQYYRRQLPFLLTGLLGYNLVQALVDPTRVNLLSVASVALLMAVILWRRGRTTGAAEPPD